MKLAATTLILANVIVSAAIGGSTAKKSQKGSTKPADSPHRQAYQPVPENTDTNMNSALTNEDQVAIDIQHEDVDHNQRYDDNDDSIWTTDSEEEREEDHPRIAHTKSAAAKGKRAPIKATGQSKLKPVKRKELIQVDEELGEGAGQEPESFGIEGGEAESKEVEPGNKRCAWGRNLIGVIRRNPIKVFLLCGGVAVGIYIATQMLQGGGGHPIPSPTASPSRNDQLCFDCFDGRSIKPLIQSGQCELRVPYKCAHGGNCKEFEAAPGDTTICSHMVETDDDSGKCNGLILVSANPNINGFTLDSTGESENGDCLWKYAAFTFSPTRAPTSLFKTPTSSFSVTPKYLVFDIFKRMITGEIKESNNYAF